MEKKNFVKWWTILSLVSAVGTLIENAITAISNQQYVSLVATVIGSGISVLIYSLILDFVKTGKHNGFVKFYSILMIVAYAVGFVGLIVIYALNYYLSIAVFEQASEAFSLGLSIIMIIIIVVYALGGLVNVIYSAKLLKLCKKNEYGVAGNNVSNEGNIVIIKRY